MKRFLIEEHLQKMAKINKGDNDVFGYNLYANHESNHPNYAHIHAIKGDKREIVYDFKGNLIHNSSAELEQIIRNISNWIVDNHNLVITVWRNDVLPKILGVKGKNKKGNDK